MAVLFAKQQYTDIVFDGIAPVASRGGGSVVQFQKRAGSDSGTDDGLIIQRIFGIIRMAMIWIFGCSMALITASVFRPMVCGVKILRMKAGNI